MPFSAFISVWMRSRSRVACAHTAAGSSGQPHSVMPVDDQHHGRFGHDWQDHHGWRSVGVYARKPDKEPFKLQIHRLTLDNVGESGVIPYHAAVFNPEPPGENPGGG